MTKFKRKRRQISKKADAILTADWHIRSDIPTCRTDDFFAAMEKKIDFILALSKEHNAPILVAGDLGQKSQWPNWLLEWMIHKFKRHDIICIPGQHDLPNHQISQFEKSGMGVLEQAEVIETIGINPGEPFELIQGQKDHDIYIYPFPYSKKIENCNFCKQTKHICLAMTHQMVIENNPLWPGQEAQKGHQLLKQFPEYNLILSGDNHKPFVAKKAGRLLINPGSMMRTTAAQIEHKPRVYLWYAQENSVEPVYLPIEKNVISREHIDIAEERSDRMDAYLERLKNDVEIQLSFENNIENYFQKNRTQLPIKQKVFAAMEG